MRHAILTKPDPWFETMRDLQRLVPEGVALEAHATESMRHPGIVEFVVRSPGRVRALGSTWMDHQGLHARTLAPVFMTKTFQWHRLEAAVRWLWLHARPEVARVYRGPHGWVFTGTDGVLDSVATEGFFLPHGGPYRFPDQPSALRAAHRHALRANDAQ